MSKVKDFWEGKWQTADTPFHRDQINPTLTTYLPRCQLPTDSRVLVPLCGKSLDMCWLMAQGYDVIGIELSAIAVEAFFNENDIDYERQQQGDHGYYTAQHITIIQGDIFTVDTATVAPCQGYYDRAALIALPAKLRPAYVAKLSELLEAGSKGIISSIDYPAEEPIGPPFNISNQEFTTLYAEYEIKQLNYLAETGASKSLVAQGIETVTEAVYQVTKMS